MKKIINLSLVSLVLFSGTFFLEANAYTYTSTSNDNSISKTQTRQTITRAAKKKAAQRGMAAAAKINYDNEYTETSSSNHSKYYYKSSERGAKPVKIQDTNY